MIKKKINILYIILGIILIIGIAIGLTFWVRSCNSNKFEKLEISAKTHGRLNSILKHLASIHEIFQVVTRMKGCLKTIQSMEQA